MGLRPTINVQNFKGALNPTCRFFKKKRLDPFLLPYFGVITERFTSSLCAGFTCNKLNKTKCHVESNIVKKTNVKKL